MCGLVVLIASPGCRVDPAIANAMISDLRHRGPDGEGRAGFTSDGSEAEREGTASLALLHRRLAVLDTDVRSNQPFWTSDRRFVAVYNGEIYNFLELKRELELAGAHFSTSSDTEVMLQAYSYWGRAAFSRFIGMFALAIFDRSNRRLVLARDRFGIKPLYWAAGSNMMGFSSEIEPLLRIPGVGRRANLDRVNVFLTEGHSDFDSATFFADVNAVPPGSVVDLPWLSQDVAGSTHTMSFPQARAKTGIQDFRAALLQNVKLHLRSDVPIGIALSGGIDSSSVVACARAVGGVELDLRTYSFRAEGTPFDESRHVDRVARHSKIFASYVAVQDGEIQRDIEDLVRAQGEPFGSLSVYAQYRVMKLAADNDIKVLLEGQGADELLGGYPHFLSASVVDAVRRGEAARALALLTGDTAAKLGRYRLFGQVMEHHAPAALARALRQMAGYERRPKWLRPSRSVRVSPREDSHGSTLRTAMSEALDCTVLPPLLRYSDRNSMRFSIESRVPFLAEPLASVAAGLPDELVIGPHGETKYVLREAMRDMLPAEIVDRRDKIAFAVPYVAWNRALRGWADELILSMEPGWSAVIDGTDLRQVLEREPISYRQGSDLWRSISLLAWARAFAVQPF